MPNIPGADARQSRTLQSLKRFTPDGITALAAVALVLLDAINKAHLAVNEARLSHDLALAYRRMLEDLYNIQDALHGDASKLPAALAEFLSMVDEAQQAAAEDEPAGEQGDVEPVRLAEGASARTDTSAHADSQPRPYFSATGNPAQFFVVSDDITVENALEGASMFLASAVSLGNNPDALDNGGRWAAVHLGEMAKALVDSVVNAQMENRRL